MGRRKTRNARTRARWSGAVENRGRGNFGIDFLDRNDPKKTGNPFFVWYNPARMHVVTVLPEKYAAMAGERGGKDWGVNEAGQEFVRVYSERVYGIPPEQVVGTMGGTKYGYDKTGKPILTKEPKLLNDNNAGKPEGIHMMVGRRPIIAFGNSTGDRQMLEFTKGGDGARLALLVLHDDAKREYAYGPAQGLPTRRSAPSPRRSTTRQRRRGGSSSA
jgi:hypothetical protein